MKLFKLKFSNNLVLSPFPPNFFQEKKCQNSNLQMLNFIYVRNLKKILKIKKF